MSFKKFKTNSYCVGQNTIPIQKTLVERQQLIKKTGKKIRLFVGRCSICGRKKSKIISDNTVQAEGLGDFFKNLGRKRT